jgi:hypothetical protein
MAEKETPWNFCMFASGNWEKFADRINCSLSKYRFWFTGSCQAGLSITMNRKSGRRTSPNAFLRGGPAGKRFAKKSCNKITTGISAQLVTHWVWLKKTQLRDR